MNYYDQNYEPSDLDGEIFLSDAPLSLLMQSIETQFEEPTEYRRKDYVQSFLTKYIYWRENEADNEETGMKDEVDEYYGQFLSFMSDLMGKKLGLGFPELGDMTDDDALELIHYTYRFFIKNIRTNFLRVCWNFLEQHRDEIVADLEDRKDITSNNYKGQIDDMDDVLLLSNLGYVIRYILMEDLSVDAFLDLVMDGDYMEAEYLDNAYDNFLVTGNFVPYYVQMVDEDLRGWLESKVRNRILKKYSYRKKVHKVLKDEDTETETEDIPAEELDED